MHDTLEVNVWCELPQNCVAGHFFFAQNTIKGDIYLDVLELFVFPQTVDTEYGK
jgi:hypothetical protein